MAIRQRVSQSGVFVFLSKSRSAALWIQENPEVSHQMMVLVEILFRFLSPLSRFRKELLRHH